MGFSTFPAVSASTPSTTFWVPVAAINTIYKKTGPFLAGAYLLTYYPTNISGTHVASIKFVDSSNTVIASVSTSDKDATSTVNPTQSAITVPSDAAAMWLDSATTGYLFVQYLGAVNLPTLTVTKYETSQSITLNATSTVCALGGGGGGGAAIMPGGGNGRQGGAGGSGYISVGNIPAGTYNLVIGARGNRGYEGPGGNGGTTTFSTLTALGGYGGAYNSSNALPQGSGGSGGGIDGSSGGSNGSGGNGSSGTQFIAWSSFGVGGTGSTAGGGGGGVYAGGGGGGANIAAGGDATGSGGGGGAGGGSGYPGGGTGGFGFAGALYILGA